MSMVARASLPEALADILAQDLPMAEGLGAYERELARLNPNVATAYDALVQRLSNVGFGANAPRVGALLPDFVLPDQNGRLRQLGDFLGAGATIVSMNRGHWCPFCRIELASLAKAHATLERAGVTMLSIMPERQAYTRLAQERGVPFTILSDLDGAYALELGLCFYIGDELVRLFRTANHQMPLFQGNESWFLPAPATYVLDREGVVVARMADPDFRRNRMAIDDIVAAVAKVK